MDMDACNKFQHLLRELFQFDTADLDFGIYRIMNHKREVNAVSKEKISLPIDGLCFVSLFCCTRNRWNVHRAGG